VPRSSASCWATPPFSTPLLDNDDAPTQKLQATTRDHHNSNPFSKRVKQYNRSQSITMMYKSKFADSCIENSTANASWDEFENQQKVNSTLARPSHSSSLETKVPPSVRSLLLRTRQQHAEQSSVVPARNETRLAAASPLKRPRRSNLIEPEMLDRLLDMLRSDGFAGKIDVEHHSHYFEPPLSEIRLSDISSRPRHQSLSQLTAARKHYFEEALLQRPSKCSRSHVAFAAGK